MPRHVRVTIIGGGFSRLGAGARLRATRRVDPAEYRVVMPGEGGGA